MRNPMTSSPTTTSDQLNQNLPLADLLQLRQEVVPFQDYSLIDQLDKDHESKIK